MDELLKNIKVAAEVIGESIANSRAAAQEEILEKLDAIVQSKGFTPEDTDKVQETFDLTIQKLQDNPKEGLLVCEAYVLGEKATKTVLAAHVLRIHYTPQGFMSGGQMAIAVHTTVEDATESFFYPESDESIFREGV
jgi:hypothetical protein